MSVAVDAKLQAALEYAGYGWHIVPMEGPASKKPSLPNWQNAASTDEETIAGWFDAVPNRNFGIQLGPKSGIIDIECDGKDAERLFIQLFGGEIPVTPTYESSRGKHRFFKFRPDLPEPDKTNFKLGPNKELEFRTGYGGKGAQSVVPPSDHPTSGKKYQWVIYPSDYEVAELPEHAFAAIWSAFHEGFPSTERQAKPQEFWANLIRDGAPEGDRNNSAAALIGRHLHDMKDPTDKGAQNRVWLFIESWNRTNRPPMDIKELKQTFDSILRRHVQNSIRTTYADATQKYGDRHPDTGETSTADWRLVKLLANPVRWKLYSHIWEHKAPGGFILLTSGQLISVRKITEAAVEQAGVLLEKDFAVLWAGTKESRGLAARLCDNFETEEVTAEEKRDYYLASILWDHIQSARSGGDDELDPRGTIRKVDGEYLFKFRQVLSEIQREVPSIEHGDFVDLLKKVGARDTQARVDGAVMRFKVLDRKAVEQLQAMSLHSSEARSSATCSADFSTQVIEGKGV